MPKCEKVTAGQAQAKEDMINMILKLLHTSSYLHVRAILCMLKKVEHFRRFHLRLRRESLRSIPGGLLQHTPPV